jgi:hypothetical protein
MTTEQKKADSADELKTAFGPLLRQFEMADTFSQAIKGEYYVAALHMFYQDVKVAYDESRFERVDTMALEHMWTVVQKAAQTWSKRDDIEQRETDGPIMLRDAVGYVVWKFSTKSKRAGDAKKIFRSFIPDDQWPEELKTNRKFDVEEWASLVS